MKTTLLKITTLALLLSASFSLTACNTTRGIGQDVEKAGEGIQKAANK